MSLFPHRSVPLFSRSVWAKAKVRQRLRGSHGCGPLSPMRYVSSLRGLSRRRQYARREVWLESWPVPSATVMVIWATVQSRWTLAMASAWVGRPA